jgi:hypothetical protein
MSGGRMKLAWRFLAAVGLLVFLGGPGPGSVGSCSETKPDVADAPQYCVNKNEALCRRTLVMCGRGVTACDNAYLRCTNGAPMEMPPFPPLIERCAGAAWPATCRPPTASQASRCIAALLASDPAHLSVPNDQVFMRFPECAEIQCTSTTRSLVAPTDASVPMPDGSTEVP